MKVFSRRAVAVLGAFLFSVIVVGAGVMPAQAAAPAPGPMLVGIRSATHPTYDRIVLDFVGGRPGIQSQRFVDELRSDPSDQIEWLTGCTFAEVVMTPAYAHDSDGHPSLPGPQKFRTRNLSNVMAVAITGDFEGYATFGIGMRKQTWMNVSTLTGPDRVVIDIGR